MIGIKRVEQSAQRWKKSYDKEGLLGLKDSREHYSGRPKSRELTDAEKMEKLEAKKVKKYEKGLVKKLDIFRMIEATNNKYNLHRMTVFLCHQAKVSRSGYYNYLNSKKSLLLKEEEDLKTKKIILKAFNKKGYKKGARSIKMDLENDFNIIYNLKKIGRIMRKYSIICPHRKPNKYKQIAKATKEHSTLPNTLNREFKQGIPMKVMLTDISYLAYGNGQRAYLSAIKDGSTNEILAYEVSDNLKLELATNTIEKLCRKRFRLTEGCFIHSDQGIHYTSPKFQNLLKRKGINQSMSRRGNCWDNAPMESFLAT